MKLDKRRDVGDVKVTKFVKGDGRDAKFVKGNGEITKFLRETRLRPLFHPLSVIFPCYVRLINVCHFACTAT